METLASDATGPLGEQAFDQKDFRHALGTFVTGVTIVTTLRVGGEPIGVTANSFSSVSLSPPLVLWSLEKSSQNPRTFQSAEYFAINILAADKMNLSQHFSRHRPDKFNGIAWQPGLGGVPMLDNVVMQLCCRNVIHHDGGDHIIFIGRVDYYMYAGRHPLVFARGLYMDLKERINA